MHLYERIPLFLAGYVVAFFLLALHGWMLAKPQQAIHFLKQFPRNIPLGSFLMAMGLLWFWLLIVPASIPSPLRLDLKEFSALSPILMIVVPIAGFLLIKQVQEFIAVRALGFLQLLSAAPLLSAAWLEPATGKNLLPFYAYMLIISGMFWVGKPYLLRDLIQWVTEKMSRFRLAAIAGLCYGAIVLFFTIMYWS